MDFSNFKISNRYYGGSERKIGITDGTNFYILKFRKRSDFGEKFNHISEFLGSHIFQILGYNVHDTLLGTYKKEEVVRCLDFNQEGSTFVPFNDIGESSLEINKEEYQYSYDDVIKLLEANKKLTNVEETVSAFFEIFIVDALIGNFDRHGSNWGFLKTNNRYTLAPIFDNGSCLFPGLVSDNELLEILNNPKEIEERIYTFPTSQIKLNNKKSSYFDVISSLQFEECNKALLKVFPKIDLDKINSLIDRTEFISDIRREFYKTIIKERYIKILKYSYDKLGKRK